jgi:hypothetical protein
MPATIESKLKDRSILHCQIAQSTKERSPAEFLYLTLPEQSYLY